MGSVILFKDKKECCGCGACMNVCPKSAISMVEDKCGFIFPHVDEKKCIECGLCKNVCAFQDSEEKNRPIKVFAAVNKNNSQLLNSASGGVFSALATAVIDQQGVVFGASMQIKNGHPIVKHRAVEKKEEICILQGSKYVQSTIGDTYKQVKNLLNQDRKVLFSGTPCQIDGLKGYLQKKYDNLITVDLICHGVPNERFFDDYIQLQKKKYKAIKITDYSFRDKKRGWGMNSRIDYETKRNKISNKYIPARLTSYNTLFLDGDIYRENCYVCKYAKNERVSDLTIGDYWGFENVHPEVAGNPNFEERRGISCIIVNTKKGMQLCSNTENIMYLYESTLEKVCKNNAQLNKPSSVSIRRNTVMELYKEKGYDAVDSWFQKKYKKQIMIHFIYNLIPRVVRIRIKKMINI